MRFMSCAFVAACVVGMAGSVSSAWDAAGHRAITWLAIDGLDKNAPAFLKEKANYHATGWEAAEPDRWRSVKSGHLSHGTYMDHYLDVEDLAEFGLTLETVNPLRYRFVRDMAVARAMHKSGDRPAGTGEFARPKGKPPYNERLDANGDQEWPGFILHAICENHGKLTASFKTYYILEKLNDPARAPQMEMAKANIMVQMGVLAHFVGDAAQPLHTTMHHHGWIGDNPKGYSTAKTIHAYIDGGVINEQGINYESLKPTQSYTHTIADPLNPWKETVEHLRRSYEKVTPLYEMEKAGGFKRDEGKKFISERLNDGANMLAALYNSAMKAGVPTDKEVEDFKRYDAFRAKDLPEQIKEPRERGRPRTEHQSTTNASPTGEAPANP